jgi:hypothetical protein
MNGRIRQAIARAMRTLEIKGSIDDSEMFAAMAVGKEAVYKLYMDRANALAKAGNSLVWAKHQLLEEETAIMAQPLPLARGTSNSLASLGELLPTRVREIRAEIESLRSETRLAFDLANEYGAIAAEYL